MSVQIHDIIRETLEKTPGLTQRGLAERMGLNPAAVNRMLYGRRNIMASEVPVIEDYLGIRLNLSSAAPPPAMSGAASLQMIPVYGAGASGVQRNISLTDAAVADWTPRHPAQAEVKGAFAVYICSDAMEPRYYRGELAYVHPARPVEAFQDCLIDMRSGDAFLCRFLRQHGGIISAAQYNPPRTIKISQSDVKAVYAVVGRK